MMVSGESAVVARLTFALLMALSVLIVIIIVITTITFLSYDRDHHHIGP